MSLAIKNQGQLLVEMLIAIALFAVVSLVIGQSLATSFFSERGTHEQDIARRLATEDIARVRAKSDVSWSSLVSVATSSIAADGTIFSGATSSVVDGITFMHSFISSPLSRDITATSGDGLLVGVATTSTVLDDRGSILVRASVSWGNELPLSIDTVLARWRNVVCGQSDWTATGTSVRDCQSEQVGYASSSRLQVGKNLQLCLGC